MTDHSRLALGTAQFGLDYGVTNTRGRVPIREVEQILENAETCGVSTLDTAAAYGSSEEVLGSFGVSHRFRVITKIQPSAAEQVAVLISKSCRRLKSERLDTVLLHDADVALDELQIWASMVRARTEGLVQRVGVSLYWPAQWHRLRRLCIASDLPLPDVIQLPLNVFDQRFVGLLSELNAHGIETHVRSVYLQGAAFFSANGVPQRLLPLLPGIERLADMSSRLGVSRAGLLQLFVLRMHSVDTLVLGIDSALRFSETIAAFDEACDVLSDPAAGETFDFSQFSISDESIILPSNWKTE